MTDCDIRNERLNSKPYIRGKKTARTCYSTCFFSSFQYSLYSNWFIVLYWFWRLPLFTYLNICWILCYSISCRLCTFIPLFFFLSRFVLLWRYSYFKSFYFVLKYITFLPETFFFSFCNNVLIKLILKCLILKKRTVTGWTIKGKTI